MVLMGVFVHFGCNIFVCASCSVVGGGCMAFISPMMRGGQFSFSLIVFICPYISKREDCATGRPISAND